MYCWWEDLAEMERTGHPQFAETINVETVGISYRELYLFVFSLQFSTDIELGWFPISVIR